MNLRLKMGCGAFLTFKQNILLSKDDRVLAFVQAFYNLTDM